VCTDEGSPPDSGSCKTVAIGSILRDFYIPELPQKWFRSPFINTRFVDIQVLADLLTGKA
jgi:hypothetical protein